MEITMPFLAALFLTVGINFLWPIKAASSNTSRRGKDFRLHVLLNSLATSRATRALLAYDTAVTLAEFIQTKAHTRGLFLTLEEAFAALELLFAGSVLVLCIVSSSAAGALLAVALWATLVPLVIASYRRARTCALMQELPQLMRSLAVALASGKTLAQAIEYVGTQDTGPASQAFSRAALNLHCGASLEEALSEVGNSMSSPGVELLSTALVMSQRTGCPLKDLLYSTARMVEEKSELQRTLQTKTAQTRLSVRIVRTMPVLLVLALASISPEFRQGCTTATGIGCLAVAIMLDAAALIIVRHLMRRAMA